MRCHISLRPRKVMLIADAVRMLLVGILAALALNGHPTLWEFIAIAVPLGALGGAFTPASIAMVPDIMSKDDLQAGNGLMMASIQGANLVGSSVAGVIVAWFTSGVALAIDVATFLVSAASLALMRGTRHALKSSKPGNASDQQGGARCTGELLAVSEHLAAHSDQPAAVHCEQPRDRWVD